MAWTQYGKACEEREDLEKSMKEIVLKPQLYDRTYPEATAAREEWRLIEQCVRELENQKEEDGLRPAWPLAGCGKTRSTHVSVEERPIRAA
jgi:hypothetical protein